MQAEPSDTHPLAQAAIDAHKVTAPADDATSRARIVDLLETFEQDIAPLVAPFVQSVVDHPDTPDHVKALLAPLVEPQHFGESVVIGIAVGSILSPVLQAGLDPLLTELAKTAWKAAIGSAGALGGVPLSPDTLATAVLKGVLTEGDAASQAIQSGVGTDAFQNLVNTAGQAIGIEQALLLFRRGDIDQAELERVVRYSNVRIDFLPDILKLQYVPPSASEAIVGALKGHLTDADAQTKLGQAGIDPTNYTWMKASAGRPPGIDQMLQLWNRGVATQADVEAAVKQSDINDTYLPFVEELRHYFPPPRSIVPMLRAGAVTEAQARTLLSYYGVGEPWATAFITEATKPTSAAVKELSASVVVRLYEQKIITRADALTRLETLKYNAADADLYLQVADDAVKERFLAAGANRVHARFISYKITAAAAAAALAKEGQPPDAAAQLMALWTLERDANVSVLTLSQIQQGYHRGIITLAQFVSMAQERGYSGVQVKILAAEAWPPTKVPAEVMALNVGSL